MLAIFIIFLSKPAVVEAATITGEISYAPENQSIDPWNGGEVVITNSYKMYNNEISFNPMFSQTVDFQITWDVPNEITGQKFVNSIKNGSILDIGNQRIPLSPSSFTFSGNTVTYRFSKNDFDFWALLRWLASLIFNPEIAINTNLILDVTTLSDNFESDNSVNKVVTSGKLPPNPQNKLSFTTRFYDRSGTNTAYHNMEIGTWSSYISPWNAVIANGVNGKNDDTQINGTTEVVGIQRVLNGATYKNREVHLSIDSTINPQDYSRVVNLYDKIAVPAATQIDKLGTTDDFFERDGKKYLVRTTSYQYSGNVQGVMLSPVPLIFKQETFLNATLDPLQQEFSENETVSLTGSVESEDENNHYYYKINGGESQSLTNHSEDKKRYSLDITGLSAGTYEITLGVTNKYSLVKELTFSLNIIKEEAKVTHVTKEIDFGKHKIPHPGDRLYSKLPFSIQIVNTYRNNGIWKLDVKIDKVMQTSDGLALPADIFMEQEGKEPIRLGNDFSTIHEIGKGITTPINFKQEEGLFLRMNSSNVRTNDGYTGSLLFVLQAGP